MDGTTFEEWVHLGGGLSIRSSIDFLASFAGVEAYVKVSPDDPAGRPVEVMVRAVGVGHAVVPREVTLVRRK